MSPPATVRDDHRWVGAAYVPLDEPQAKYSNRRGRILLGEVRVDVLEVMCAACRRPYDEASEQPCVTGEWLHGGPIDERISYREREARTG